MERASLLPPCRPRAGACRGAGASFPRASATRHEQAAGSRCKFLVHGNGCPRESVRINRPIEPHEIWMADPTVRNVDVKGIRRVAGARLRLERKVPRAIVVGVALSRPRIGTFECDHANR